MSPSTHPQPPDQAPGVAAGGGGGYIEDMDRRLTVLETRFDTILPTLATKADLAELKAEFKAELADLRAEFKAELAGLRAEYKSDFGDFRADIHDVIISTHRWLIGTIIVLLLGFGGMILTMTSVLKQRRQPIAQAAVSQPAATAPPVRVTK